MANESEEFEFRARMEREKKRVSAVDYVVNQAGAGNRIGQGLKKLGEVPYAAGEKVSDLASSAGAPPEMAGGLGYGANVALQSIPMLLGGEAAKLGGEAAGVPLNWLSKILMRSALKPDRAARATGKGERAINTLLDEGINVSRGGIDVAKDRIGDLNKKLYTMLDESDKTINKHQVANYLQDVIKKFENRPNAIEAQRDVENAWKQFIEHPKTSGLDEISVKTAQELKQGYQQSVGDKGYGELKTAATESEKAVARGLREKLIEVEPSAGPILNREADLINALKQMQKRVSAEGNNNVLGLAPLAHSPAAFIAFLADKWGLTKSAVARVLNTAAKGAPGFAADSARGGIALSEIHNQVGRQPEMTSY